MKPEGIIALRDCSCTEGGTSDKLWKFVIDAPTKAHNFFCDSEEEMKSWIQEISSQIVN